MIIGFDRPHAIGSVCRFPCPQCGETPSLPGKMWAADPDHPVDPPPMLIIREATREEHRRFVIENTPDYYEIRQAAKDFGFFYKVSTD